MFDRIKNTLEDYKQGPAIDENLLVWLDAEAGERMLLLPMDVYIDSDALGCVTAYLRAGNTEIEFKLDDGAMSIDLPMHLKSYCDSYPCRVWLEGTWGSLIPGLPPSGILPIFSVRGVLGNVDEQEKYIRI